MELGFGILQASGQRYNMYTLITQSQNCRARCSACVGYLGMNQILVICVLENVYLVSWWVLSS